MASPTDEPAAEAVIYLPDGTVMPPSLVRACCPYVGQPLWGPCGIGRQCREGHTCYQIATDECRNLLADLWSAGWQVVPLAPP